MTDRWVVGLAESVAAAVLAVPGVIRIEPSLNLALRRLTGTGPAGSGALAVSDGVHLSARGELVDVKLDIVTGPDVSALATASAAAVTVRAALALTGKQAGQITVNVLEISVR